MVQAAGGAVRYFALVKGAARENQRALRVCFKTAGTPSARPFCRKTAPTFQIHPKPEARLAQMAIFVFPRQTIALLLFAAAFAILEHIYVNNLRATNTMSRPQQKKQRTKINSRRSHVKWAAEAWRT